jgi:hypothetical protein
MIKVLPLGDRISPGNAAALVLPIVIKLVNTKESISSQRIFFAVILFLSYFSFFGIWGKQAGVHPTKYRFL